MIRSSLILLLLVSLTTAAVKVDSSYHCECTELNQTDCENAQPFCLWNSSDNECQEFSLVCSDLTTSTTCNSFNSCKWITNSCEDWTPSCSDGTNADLCNNIDECYWNKNNTCASFTTCTDYSVQECPYDQWCVTTNGSCEDYKFVTCSSFTGIETCIGFDSKTSRCAWANDKQCKSLQFGTTCADLSNFTFTCNSSSDCIYDGSTCRIIKCSDILEQYECKTAQPDGTNYTLCKWTNDACAEAADTASYTESNCYSRTYGNYKWSDNKCVACDELVSNDSESNSFILGAVALLFVLLQ